MAFYPVKIPWASPPPTVTPISDSLFGTIKDFRAAGAHFSSQLTNAVKLGINTVTGSTGGALFNGTSAEVDVGDRWVNTDIGRLLVVFVAGPTGAVRPLFGCSQTYSSTRKFEIRLTATGQLQFYSGWNGDSSHYTDITTINTVPGGVVAALVYSDSANSVAISVNGMSQDITGANNDGFLAKWFRDNLPAPNTYKIGAVTTSSGTTWFNGEIMGVFHGSGVLSQDLANALTANPWQIFQPLTIWIPVSGGGGTSYTETLTALAEGYAAVTDIAIYIDAAEAIITAGATADATVQMLEGVLSAAVVAASLTDTAVVVDTVQTGATADATALDTAQMVENAATAAAAEASVTDAIVSGVAENLLASATSLASATDVQLMVDNLTIMAASGASVSEIYTYLEQLTAAATSGASVTDVLVTQFVGRYLFVVTVPPREFTATVSPRSYLTTVGPR